MYDDIDEDNATLLIDDVARVDGIISNVQGRVEDVEEDNVIINSSITTIESDIEGIETSITTIELDIDDLEQANISIVSTLANKVNVSDNPITGFSGNSSTYVLTFTHLNGATTTFDLPAEMAFTDASYSDVTKDLTFELQNGSVVSVPLDNIITGLATTT